MPGYLTYLRRTHLGSQATRMPLVLGKGNIYHIRPRVALFKNICDSWIPEHYKHSAKEIANGQAMSGLRTDFSVFFLMPQVSGTLAS